MPKLGVQKKDGSVVYFDWNKPTEPTYEEAIAEAERQATPPQPAPKPSVSQDIAEGPSLMSPRSWWDEVKDVLPNFAAEGKKGIYQGGDWIRRQADRLAGGPVEWLGTAGWEHRPVENPDVQRGMETSDTTGGMIGSALEQAIEYGTGPAVLERAAAKTAFPWLAKKAVQAGLGGSQAFLHSGGDPTQTAIGATAGVAIPAIVNPLFAGAGKLIGRETAEQAAARIAKEAEALRGGTGASASTAQTGTAGPIRPPSANWTRPNWADPRVPPNVQGTVGVPEPPYTGVGRQIPPTNPQVVSTGTVPPPVNRTGARQPAGAFAGPRPQIAQYSQPIPPPQVPFDPRSAFGAPVDLPFVPPPEPLGIPSRSVTTPRFEGPEVGAPGATIDVDVPPPAGIAGTPPPNAPSPTGIIRDPATGRFRRMTMEESVNVPSQNVPFNQLPDAEKNAFREFLKVSKPELGPVIDDPAYIASDTDYLAFLKQQEMAGNAAAAAPPRPAYPPNAAGQVEFVGTSSPGRAATDVAPAVPPEPTGLTTQRPDLPFGRQAEVPQTMPTGEVEPSVEDLAVMAADETGAVPSEGRAEISDLMDRLAASLKNKNKKIGETGQALPRLAIPFGGGVLGGAVGGTQGDTTSERIENALLGAMIGAGGTHVGAGAIAGGKAGAKTALREAGEQLNAARMIPMLTGLAPTKSFLGNIGSFGTGALEDVTRGNFSRAGRTIKELFNVPENIRQFKTGWTAGQSPYQTTGIGALNYPGKFMGASDYAAQQGLQRAGRTAEEASESLLTSPLGVHGTTAEIMNSPIGKYFMPFQRTPINTALQFGKKAMERPVLSAGAAGAGYLAGGETDDPRKIGLASALAGPYAGAFLAGAAAGSGKGSLFGSISPVPEWGLTKSLEEGPTGAFMKPAFVSAFKEMFKGDEDYPESWSGKPSRETKQEQARKNRERRRRDFLNR